MKKSLLSFLLFLLINITAHSGVVYYVNHNVVMSGSGTAWGSAFKTIQEALEAAVAGDEIWVAAGTYVPTSAYDLGNDDPRLKHFRLKNGVSLYGGFAGTETELSQRNFTANVTILSGDLGSEVKTYHVFFHYGLILNASAILDGFTITGGNANKAEGDDAMIHQFGGGMANIGLFNMEGEEPVPVEGTGSSPTVRNCIFKQNGAVTFGGGMANLFGSVPDVSNSMFVENTSTHGGGMINVFNSGGVLTNVSFERNQSSNEGGALANWHFSPVVVNNCSFIENISGGMGGGMENYKSNATITNSVFRGNKAKGGGAMRNNEESVVTITGTLIKGNIAEGDESQVGGAIFNKKSTTHLMDCNLEENTAQSNGGAVFNTFSGILRMVNCVVRGNESLFGAGVFNETGSNAVIINSLFTGNKAEQSGGGIVNESGTMSVINATLSENLAGLTGLAGGIYNSSDLTVRNSIIWGNTAGSYNEIHNATGNISVNYSCYADGVENHNITPGLNDIHNDPLFKKSGDHPFLIPGNSPCTDGGNNTPFETGGIAEGIATDIRGSGFPRILKKSTGLPPGGIVDMGAYETNEIPTRKPVIQVTESEPQFINYPNPFEHSTTITYTHAKSGHVELIIYNILGQVVKTLENTEKPAGTYKVTWEGSDDNGNTINRGIYFCRLKTGNFENKVIKIQYIR